MAQPNPFISKYSIIFKTIIGEFTLIFQISIKCKVQSSITTGWLNFIINSTCFKCIIHPSNFKKFSNGYFYSTSSRSNWSFSNTFSSTIFSLLKCIAILLRHFCFSFTSPRNSTQFVHIRTKFWYALIFLIPQIFQKSFFFCK